MTSADRKIGEWVNCEYGIYSSTVAQKHPKTVWLQVENARTPPLKAPPSMSDPIFFLNDIKSLT
jgi:hypothetical protein